MEVTPKNGETYELEELQGYVGGWVQVVNAFNGKILVLNEDGKMIGLEVNEKATRMYSYVLAAGDCLVGDVLVINNSELV